jgi:hypothetical protein
VDYTDKKQIQLVAKIGRLVNAGPERNVILIYDKKFKKNYQWNTLCG